MAKSKFAVGTPGYNADVAATKARWAASPEGQANKAAQIAYDLRRQYTNQQIAGQTAQRTNALAAIQPEFQRGLDATKAYCVRELQSGHSGTRCRRVGRRGRLSLHLGRSHQYVSAHRACGKHGGF